MAALSSSAQIDPALLRAMCRSLTHRGPDDEGYYEAPGIGMGMRRLSIIDLATGHQPVANEDGAVQVVFNGEIYNFHDIRRRLEQAGHRFRTHSDTEVIVHAYEEYGDRCVEHFNGMFAFAIWDAGKQRLFLARDRVGIKPLYYAVVQNLLIFGSELKAVITHPIVPRVLDLAAMDHFLTLEYIPSPRTIFRDVQKLPPGHVLCVERGQPFVAQYWDVPSVPIQDDDAACTERLTELIQDAVRLRMIADVPLGAFLSGGVDSSTIVSFMSQMADRPVRTFSIGFEDATYNELPYARAVAAAFGAEHHEEILNPDIATLTQELVAHLDEPFGDFSILPTYLVSQVARKHVKVALSGDGGDELFAGYDTYLAQRLAHRYSDWLPIGIRRDLLLRTIDLIPPQPAKKGVVNMAKRFMEGAALPAALQHTRWMIFMNELDKARLYRPDIHADVNGSGAEAHLEALFRQADRADALTKQQYVDVKTYLAEDILTKVDRMSMAVSLEARVPLLDYRIVEFALNLPAHLKISGATRKAILRSVASNRLPEQVLNKPKQGFSIPIKHWLRAELKPMVMDLLAPDVVKQRGYFNPECVVTWLNEHMAGSANHSHRLWSLMVFELWHRQIMDNHIHPAPKDAILVQ